MTDNINRRIGEALSCRPRGRTRYQALVPQVLTVLCALLLDVVSASFGSQQIDRRDLSLSTAEELKADLSKVPCKSDQRMAAAIELFERVGADKEEISVEKFKVIATVIQVLPAASNRLVVGNK